MKEEASWMANHIKEFLNSHAEPLWVWGHGECVIEESSDQSCPGELRRVWKETVYVEVPLEEADVVEPERYNYVLLVSTKDDHEEFFIDIRVGNEEEFLNISKLLEDAGRRVVVYSKTRTGEVVR